MLKQIGGFFHIIKESPNHKSGNWSQLGKECIYTNISQTNLKKEQKLLGKYIEIQKIPPIEHEYIGMKWGNNFVFSKYTQYHPRHSVQYKKNKK